MSTVLKIYIINKTKNHDYDTYLGATVVARDEKSAKTIYPGRRAYFLDNLDDRAKFMVEHSWVSSVDDVTATEVGIFNGKVNDNEIDPERFVLLSSYRAG